MCPRNGQYEIYVSVKRAAIRPAMICGGECWAIRKCEQNQMNTTEIKMLRWIQLKTRTYHIISVIIRGNAHIFSPTDLYASTLRSVPA